jgi:hypothetical protein
VIRNLESHPGQVQLPIREREQEVALTLLHPEREKGHSSSEKIVRK